MKLACVAGAMVVAGPAFGITVNLTDFTFSPAIGVVTSGTQTYSGRAGEFIGNIGGGPLVAALSLPEPFSTGGTSFVAYCVELTQGFSFGVDYEYNPLAASAYFTPQKAADLSRLFTGTAGFVTDRSTSGAMQAAIWEIVYEPGTVYAMDSGAFKVSPASAADALNFASINLILANLATYAPSAVINVLQNDKRQDFIVGTIPEPGTWALLVAGLGVVAAVARRRKP